MTGRTSRISTLLRDRTLQLPGRRRMSPCLQIIVAVIMPLVLCVYVPLTRAQPGFVSIDCGSSTTYNDTNGITWVPDTGYTFTGRNYVPNPKTTNPLDSLRYFPENRAKNCYVLPATPNNFYMVRVSFLYPDFLNSSFRLEMEAQLATTITFQANSLTIPQVYEAYLSATSDTIYVCLARSTTTDVPFISSLELRPLDTNNMYQILAQGNYLYNDYHANFGSATPLIRYPYDPYDRPWRNNIPGVTPNSTQLAINTTSNVSVGSNHWNKVPEIVMQTADSWPKGESVTITTSFLPDYNKNYYIAFDFAEISPQAESQSRIFSLALNGQTVLNNISIANLVGGMYVAVEIYFDDIMLNSTGSWELNPDPTSQLGPILNALELFVLTDPAPNRTFLADALAIESVKESLNLTSWTGDPCVHTLYDWIKCNDDTIPRVITVDLSNYNLTAILPEALNNLTELTKLWLNNNSLTGPIPNLSALTNLQSLRLEDNILTGNIPAWLASLPSLQELLLSDNNLSGGIPPALLKNTNLTFEVFGNPQLCDGTNACTPSVPPTSQSHGDHNKKLKNKLRIILPIGGLLIGGLLIIGLVFLLYHLWRLKHQGWQQVTLYTFEAVSTMTNNFAATMLLGEGGFSSVYRGELADGTTVAVKRAVQKTPGHSRLLSLQFQREIKHLSRMRHANLVSLLGYCQEGAEKILILEYLPNGNLEQRLYGTSAAQNPLNWKTRLDIALGAAKGLEHLHEGGMRPILHHDIKTSNILLSEDMVAKVADLGFSKLLEVGASDVSSDVITGTFGYFDPNYWQTRKFTMKSDVYSFGIVLLELICGCPSISQDRGHIGEWAKSHVQQNAGMIDGIIDTALDNNYDIKSIQKVAKIAIMSIAESDADRPTMRKVVKGLQKAIKIERNSIISGNPIFFNAQSHMLDPNSASAGEIMGSVHPSPVPT